MARKKKTPKPRQPRCAFYVVDASGKVHGRGASSEKTLAARAKRVGRKHEGVRVVQLCSGDRLRALRKGRVPDGFAGLGSSHVPVAYPIAGTPEEHAARALDEVHQAKKWADQHRNIDALAYATRANAEAAWAERPDLMEYSSLIGDAMERRLRAGEVNGLGALPAHGPVDHQQRLLARRRRGAVPSVIPR